MIAGPWEMAPLYSAGEVPTRQQTALAGRGDALVAHQPRLLGRVLVARPGPPSLRLAGRALSSENPHGGSGHLMILLLGQSPLQLIENQFAMLFEYAQRPFERMEHRLSNPRGVARI